MSVRNTILDNLRSKLKLITKGNGYNIQIAGCERMPLNYDVNSQYKPFIAILESTEDKLVEDQINIRYSLPIMLDCQIEGQNPNELITKFTDDIKSVIYEPVDLGSYCLGVQYAGQENYSIENELSQAGALIAVQIIYYDAKSGGAAIGTDIYGSNDVIKTVKDIILGHLNTLKSTMSNGSYDPAYSYVYENHTVAAMNLNALTIELDHAERGPGEPYSGNAQVQWSLDFSIRLHTGYSGDFNDGNENERILNSIIDYLSERNLLGTNTRLAALMVDNRVEFPDSETVGGSIMINVQRYEEYTQT